MNALPLFPHPSFSVFSTMPSTPSSPSLFLASRQILKLYGWEPSFQAQVESIRGEELKVMKKFAYLTSVSTFIFSCAPAVVSAVKEPRKKSNVAGQGWSSFFLFFFLTLSFFLQVSVVTFAVFVGVSSENMLTAEKAFTSISLFNILRFPLAMLPMLIAAMVQVRELQPTAHV